MKVKALRSFIGREGSVRAGNVIDVSDTRGRDLERRGLVVSLLTGVRPMHRPAPQIADAKIETAEVADSGAANPTQPRSVGVSTDMPSIPDANQSPEPPPGGPTGEAQPLSSSPQDPPRRKRRSRSRKASAEPLL